MNKWLTRAALLQWLLLPVFAADFTIAPQTFAQEIASHFTASIGLPSGAVQLIERSADGSVRAFAGGRWFQWRGDRWTHDNGLDPREPGEFAFADTEANAVRVSIPWADVLQLIHHGEAHYIATAVDPFVVRGGRGGTVGWPSRYRVNQIAVSQDGVLFVASSAGLFARREQGWEPVRLVDRDGRIWGDNDILGVAFDANGQLWFASKAGAATQGTEGRIYDIKDGRIPWNDFTGIYPAPDGNVWFGTRLGAIRFDGEEWHYRQGPRWLPHDHVSQVLFDGPDRAWIATAGGVGLIERKSMTLAEKAEYYEQEIERYIQRTPYGYVAEAHLRTPAGKASADPQDSDNDGLWTAMYGAGECFAYAATGNPKAQARAKKVFEALRFLQNVTQGGSHSPPPGYIARTIRPTDWPDPNIGRLERDREAQRSDALWKAYEPRWPKSADGKWFWKSDTSSDELDGHYFFYPLYYDFCASSEEEKARVREVVRGVTDHLLTHRFVLIDHDGQPTRWAIFGPQFLNRDPMWWPERGLNSLSILSYLAVAAHITGDRKYEAALRDLVENHAYAQNAMYPKVQQGPGSGNQSDDEMAFMCFYSLLRCSKDEALKSMIRASLFRYWIQEEPEGNPLFNFICAAQNLGATAPSPWGNFPVNPWQGWHAEAMRTLYGFPLDRLNWPHRNSHRLDVQPLSRVRARDFDSPDQRKRGYLGSGRVLPVENRHFNHWNTDPWQLDYGGNGDELAAGTVFLLPYYMGLHHGYIAAPASRDD